MNLSIDCYECVVKQAVLLARNSTDDVRLQKQIMKEACRLVQESDEDIYPTYLQVAIENYVRGLVGSRDFYTKEKQDSIELIQKAMPFIEEYLQEHNL